MGCDYRVLLACCVAHPRRQASGVVFWSQLAAQVVGFDHGGAIEGLVELDRQGLIVFDTNTLESLPADHFLVNH